MSDLHGRLHNAATKEKDWGGSKRRPKAKLLLCQDCGRLEPPRKHHRPRRLRSAVRWRWFARVNALCNLSRKTSREVAASLPGRFLCRRCFRLCITMEVEPRTAKKYKCHHCCSCKNYRDKWGGGGGGGEVSLRCCFFGWPEDREFVRGRKCVLGHPIARATSYCLLPDTLWLRASKNAFKVGSVKFADSLSPLSVENKVRTGSKSSQGT